MRGETDAQSHLLGKLLFTEFVKYIELLSQDNVFKETTACKFNSHNDLQIDSETFQFQWKAGKEHKLYYDFKSWCIPAGREPSWPQFWTESSSSLVAPGAQHTQGSTS